MELRLVVLKIFFRDTQIYRAFGVNKTQTYSQQYEYLTNVK